jgi:hypothetical protein
MVSNLGNNFSNKNTVVEFFDLLNKENAMDFFFDVTEFQNIYKNGKDRRTNFA